MTERVDVAGLVVEMVELYRREWREACAVVVEAQRVLAEAVAGEREAPDGLGELRDDVRMLECEREAAARELHKWLSSAVEWGVEVKQETPVRLVEAGEG